MVGPRGLGCQFLVGSELPEVFEMKGNKHHKGDAVPFFARFISPPSCKPQAECAGQQGECCPTDTGILMGCCHLTKNVEHCGWSVGEMTDILVS